MNKKVDRAAIVEAWQAEWKIGRTTPRFCLIEVVDRIAKQTGATPADVRSVLLDDAEGMQG
jgi:hypothetical protein